MEPRVGFVLKDSDEDELQRAVAAAGRGARFVCAAAAEQLANAGGADTGIPLTPVEIEVLRLIAYGKTSREMAELRHSSVHTIITHKKNIFRKLDVNTAYEAMRYAIRAGLADPVEYYI